MRETFINEKTGKPQEFEWTGQEWVPVGGVTKEQLLAGGALPGVALSAQDIEKIKVGGQISPTRQLGTDASQFQQLNLNPPTGVMESFGKGIPLGLTNMGAGLAKLTGALTPQQVDITMGVEQARLGSKESPIASMLGQGVGEALAAPVPGSVGATLPAKVLASGLTGAGIGAVSGAGRGQDIGESAAIGGVLGTAIPPALIGTAKLASKVPGVVTGAARSFSPKQTAQKMVEKAFIRDSVNVEETLKQAANLGPEGRLIDLGEENIRQLAQTVALAPGKAAQLAKSTLTKRGKNSVNRMIQAARISTGESRSAFQTTAKLIEDRRILADPLYKEAHAIDINVGDQLSELMSRPAMKTAFRKGANKAANDVDFPPSLKYKGDLKSGDTYPLIAFDYTKRALDDKIGAAIRAGNKDEARIFMGLKNELLSYVDGQAPSFKAAREIFSDQSAMKSAIETGKKILSSDAEETASLVESMATSEREMFTVGAMKAITDKFKGVAEGGNAARRFATDLMKERIKPAFKNEQDYQGFVQAMENENIFAQSKNILGGSQTQPRQVVAGQLASEAALDAATGGYLNSALNVIRKNLSKFNQIPEKVRDEVGEILFSESLKNKSSTAIISKLKRKGLRKKQIDDILNQARNVLGGASASVGVQLND